jgi:hypothetical protein
MPLALGVSCSEPVPGSVGFARYASACPPACIDISPGPSTATIAAPPPGSGRCNTAGVLAAAESTVCILSAGSTAAAADESDVAACRELSLDFGKGL